MGFARDTEPVVGRGRARALAGSREHLDLLELQRVAGNKAFGAVVSGRAPRARVSDRRLQRAVGLVHTPTVKDVRTAQDKAEVDEIAHQLVREGKGPLYDFYSDPPRMLTAGTEEYLVGHGNPQQLDRLNPSDLAGEIAKRIPDDQRKLQYRIKIYACHVGRDPNGLAATATMLLRFTHPDLHITAAAGFVHKTGWPPLSIARPAGPPTANPTAVPKKNTGDSYGPERPKEYVLSAYAHGTRLDRVEKESYRLAAMDVIKSDLPGLLESMTPGDVAALMDVLDPKGELRANLPAELKQEKKKREQQLRDAEKTPGKPEWLRKQGEDAEAESQRPLAAVRAVLERLTQVPIGKEKDFLNKLKPFVPDIEDRYKRRVQEWARYFWYAKAKVIETAIENAPVDANVHVATEPWKTYKGERPPAAPGPPAMHALHGAPVPHRPTEVVAQDDDW